MEAGRGGDLPEQLLGGAHRRRLADDPVEGVAGRLLRLQALHLAAEAGRLERLPDEEKKLVEVDRLVEVVPGPPLHRLDGVLDGREGRDQDDERLRVPVADLPQHLEAVEVGEPEVEQDEIGALVRDEASASVPVSASTTA